MRSSSIPYVRGVDEDEVCIKDAPEGCGASLACNPLRGLHRYLILFFICFLSFGSYFCGDSPAALQDVMTRDMGLTEVQFLNLYASYSWPNVILSLVGGFLIDRVFGVAFGAIIFSLLVLIGQLIFGVGGLVNSIGLMYFARFIFGIGSESLAVAQNTYTTEWFPSSELNFVFGLQLSICRIGSTVSMNTLQPLYRNIGENFNITGYVRLGVTLMIAALTCLFSTGCAFILAFFTKRARRILAAHKAYFATQQSNSQRVASSDTEQVLRISVKDIIHFPAGIWLICVVCVSYYVTIFPLVSLGLVFFKRRFYLSVQAASVVNSMIYLVSAVASPLWGAAIDFTGCNLNWVLCSVLLTLMCHLGFAFVSHTIPPVIIMIVMGLAYSILSSSLWPLVAYLLPIHKRGTAYGLIQSVQNLGLAVVSIFAGYLVDTKGYLILEIFFTICLSVCLAMVFVMYAWDEKHGCLMNESGKCRRAKQMIEVTEQPLLESDAADDIDSLLYSG